MMVIVVLKYNGHPFATGSHDTTGRSIGEACTLASSHSYYFLASLPKHHCNAGSWVPTISKPASVFYHYCSSRCRDGKDALSVDCKPDNPKFQFRVIGPPAVLHSKKFDKLRIRDVFLANRNDPRFWNSPILLDDFGLEGCAQLQSAMTTVVQRSNLNFRALAPSLDADICQHPSESWLQLQPQYHDGPNVIILASRT
ncbi:hypothetical protein IW262DRAFT_120975 [Armillaria fumosa]|nr:hypothetical protein IW262DRAFT_120975 [Armillaria fumosa]